MRACVVVVALAFVSGTARAADRRAPDYLPRYDLAIEIDDCSNDVHVTEQVTWTNRTSKPVGQLVFNVHSHFTPPKDQKEVEQIAKLLEIFRLAPKDAIFFREAFDLRKAERLTRDGADWKRQEIPFQWNKDLATALVVALPEAVAPGASVTVSLSFTMHLPQKQGRWGRWKGVTQLSNWHPVLAFHDEANGWQPTPFIPYHQPWFNEAGVFRVRLRLPKDEKVACTGSVAKTTVGDNTKDLEIGPVTARAFDVMTSARYQEFSATTPNGDGHVKVKCMAFPEHEHYAKSMVRHASRAIENYAKWLGPYPYAEFTIAETFFGWNGNECAGLIMIDERVFTMPHLADHYVQYLVSHETCHQWLYNVIGTHGYKETFVDEAIVTHLSHRLLDQLEGKNNDLLNYPPWLGFLPGIKRENYRFSQFYGIVKDKNLAPAVMDLEKYGNPIALFAAVYDRGSKVVGIIEQRLGPTAFLDFLRRLYTKYYFRVLRVSDLQRELEEYTGQKWDRFFKEWLTTPGLSDWAVDGVEPSAAASGTHRTRVILSQRAQIDEDTVLGFSFDGGCTYPVKVPVKVPPRDGKAKDPPAAAEGGVVCTRVDETRVAVEVDLPQEPSQVRVDPDQVLPDLEPANNVWRKEPNYRPRPLYTFLDETNFTNDFDKWNVIYGPWAYGAPYAEAWFTRSSVVGARAGLYRTEEFRGGVYTGYRPTFGDVAMGFDAHMLHWPWPKWEAGVHGEMSVGQFMQRDNFNPNRGVAWLRHNIEPISSLYLLPREYAEGFITYQNEWLPNPRRTVPTAVAFNSLTQLGVHYHKDTQIPYWDPEMGYKIDGSYAIGLPLFGQERVSHQFWGQVSWVTALPESFGWWSDVKVALRAGGAVGFPTAGRLFTLGGNLWYRGFDVHERQGSCMWVGSVEVRIPIKKDVDFDVADRIARLKNVYVAPFYDIGDIYIDRRSLGPTAHAVGVGLRLDVAFFSFLERASIRVDVAKTLGSDRPVQMWFGVQQPF